MKKQTMKRHIMIAIGMAMLLAWSGMAHAQWNATSDFSINNGNPNGQWSYGTVDATTFGGNTFTTVFALDPSSSGSLFGSGMEGWFNGSRYHAHNQTGSTITFDSGDVPLGKLFTDLNATGATSLRWTAPALGSYDITGAFTGLVNQVLSDGSGYTKTNTTSRVRVVLNLATINTELFSAFIGLNGSGQADQSINSQSYATNLLLSAGDTLDFWVDFGDDPQSGTVSGKVFGDMTGLNATINAVVPEPTAVTMIGLGGLLLARAARRRR